MHISRSVALAMVALSCLPFSPAAADALVDLTELPWTAKAGFAPSDRDGFPAKHGRRVAGFPIVLNDIFDVPPGGPLQHFTLQTTFPLEAPQAGGALLGLQLATLGENWAIYINGELLAEEMSERDGKLAYRRSLRDVLMALPPAMLRRGENRLVLHLVGDAPATRLTPNSALGFFQRSGYRIDALDNLKREHRDYGTLFLLAMFALFTAYAGVLAWFRREERHHAYLVALCALLTAYFFTRARYVFDLVHDTAPVTRAEYGTLFAAGGLMFAFLHAFLQPARRWTPFLRYYVPFSWALAAAVLFVPFGYTDPLLVIWQAASIAAAIYMVWYVGRLAASRVPDAVSLLPSLFLFSATVLWDITDSIVLRTGLRYSQYAFALYIATLAYVVAMRAIRMRNQTLRHLAELHARESRLHALFEASFEALVLHRGGKIVDVNPSFESMFGYPLAEARGMRVDALFPGAAPPRGGEADGPKVTAARRRDGTRFAVETLNRPWAWDGVTGEVLTLRDVDAAVRAEDELRARNAELEILVRSMHERETKLHELEAELERLRKQRES